MVVNSVLRRPLCECCDVRVVSVGENPHSIRLEDLRQQVPRPEDIRVAACPCIFGVAVEAVDKDDTIAHRQSVQIVARQGESLVIDRGRLRGINILDQWFLALRAVDFGHANLLDLLGLGCADRVRHGSLSCGQNERSLLSESTLDLDRTLVYIASEPRRSRGASDRPEMGAAWRAC